MNDQATAPRRTLPDGRPAPDTAPDSALLDHDDLATMYKALREGNAVGLSSDGHVFIDSNHPAPPIDIADQRFVEGKLAEMKGMLEMGFLVKVHPDGSITANSTDNSFQYRADAHHELTADDRAFVHDSLVGGGNIGIRPDGTIEVNYPPGAERRQYVDDVDRIMNELDNQISSGKLGDAARSGSGLVIAAGENGATQFEYRVQPPSTAPAIPFPADARDPMDPTAPAAMQDEAKQLTDRAEAIRATSPAAADVMDKRAQALSDAADHLNEANRLRTEAGNSEHFGNAEEAQRIQEQSERERQLGTDALTTARGIEVDTTVPDPATTQTTADTQPAGADSSSAGDGAGGTTDTGAGTPGTDATPSGTGAGSGTDTTPSGTPPAGTPAQPVTLPPSIELAGTDSLGDPVMGGATAGAGATSAGTAGGTGTLGTDQTLNPPVVDTPVDPNVLGDPNATGAGTGDAGAGGTLGTDQTLNPPAVDTPIDATALGGDPASSTDVVGDIGPSGTSPEATLGGASAGGTTTTTPDAGVADTGTQGTPDPVGADNTFDASGDGAADGSAADATMDDPTMSDTTSGMPDPGTTDMGTGDALPVDAGSDTD